MRVLVDHPEIEADLVYDLSALPTLGETLVLDLGEGELGVGPRFVVLEIERHVRQTYAPDLKLDGFEAQARVVLGATE